MLLVIMRPPPVSTAESEIVQPAPLVLSVEAKMFVPRVFPDWSVMDFVVDDH